MSHRRLSYQEHIVHNQEVSCRRSNRRSSNSLAMKQSQDLNDKVFQNTRKSWAEVREELRKGGGLTSMSVKQAMAQMAKDQRDADQQEQLNASIASIDPKDLLTESNSSHHNSSNGSVHQTNNNSSTSTTNNVAATTNVPSTPPLRKLTRMKRNSHSLSDLVQTVSDVIRKPEIINEDEELGNRLWRSNSTLHTNVKGQCIYTEINKNKNSSDSGKSKLMLDLQSELEVSRNKNKSSGNSSSSSSMSSFNSSSKMTSASCGEDSSGRLSLAGMMLLKSMPKPQMGLPGKPQMGLPGRSVSDGSIMSGSRRTGGASNASTRFGRLGLDARIMSVALNEHKSSNDTTNGSTDKHNILPRARDLVLQSTAHTTGSTTWTAGDDDDDDQSIDIFGEDPSFHEDANDTIIAKDTNEENNEDEDNYDGDLLETWNHDIVSRRRDT